MHTQDIRFATNLTIFHVGLRAPGGFIDGRLVPLSASGALESGLHGALIL